MNMIGAVMSHIAKIFRNQASRLTSICLRQLYFLKAKNENNEINTEIEVEIKDGMMMMKKQVDSGTLLQANRMTFV